MIKLEVYFDGLCRVCSREIEYYRRKETQGMIRWVDITAPDFSATREGLDAQAIHRVMHVRDFDGRVHTGVSAFIEIWKLIPGFRMVAHVASFRLIRPIFDLGYAAFAKIRPYLPKKKRLDCADDRCSN